MLPARQILPSSNNLILAKPKLLLNRQLQVLACNEPGDLIELHLRSNHDTPDNGTLAQRHGSNIRHLVLWALGKESDASNDTAVGDGVDTLGDGAGATVLEDDVGAVAVGDLQDLVGPVGSVVVVDDVVDAIGLLDVLQLLV
jgi:hypothetical protein